MFAPLIVLILSTVAFVVKDYYDPSWVAIERILGLEKIGDEHTYEDDCDNPDAAEGTGRQICIKWANKNYAESTWEYEQDLILNDVQYLDQITLYKLWKQKPSKEDTKTKIESGKAEFSRLYNIFCAESVSQERGNIIEDYQLDLMSMEFKNGGKLRDYQAEGVSWLLSNHIKQVGSILADEMGLG